MEISVIMPVYNRCFEMKKALESLVAQTFKNFELIIIDDGSTDNILQTIFMYRDILDIKYIRVEHTENIAFLRNLGLRLSSGKYIAILDSDDWCVPNRLYMQYEYLEKHQDVDILATWVHIKNECEHLNNKFLENLYNMEPSESGIIIKFLNEGCCICNSTVMMRKCSVVELGGYDERMHICEDFNLWLRAFIKKFSIKILDKKLVFRIIHKNSVTRGYDGSVKAIRLVIFNKLLYLFQSSIINNKAIIIWGESARSEILVDLLAGFVNKNQVIRVVNVYDKKLPGIVMNSYNLVTTYTLKNSIFEYFDNNNLKIVEDYIYM